MDKFKEIGSNAKYIGKRLETEAAKQFISKYTVLLVLVLFVILASIISEDFLSSNNILNILRQVAANGIIAIGMTYVILTAGIDISVGAIVGFASITFAACFQPSGLIAPFDKIAALINSIMPGDNVFSLIIAGLFVLILCGLLGLINGLGISRSKIPPFIMTMSMLTMIKGLALLLCMGKPLYLDSVYREQINWMGSGRLFNIPVPVIILAVVFAIAWLILTKNVFGRYVRAIGGNEEAARVAGINVKKYKTSVYVISAVLAGLAGIMISCRTATGEPLLGSGYEMDAIAATVIGGTVLSGGVGTISGTIYGVLIIGVINNILNLLNVSPYFQYIIKGLIIFTAVLIRTDRKKK